jgi:hypothetical protein
MIRRPILHSPRSKHCAICAGRFCSKKYRQAADRLQHAISILRFLPSPCNLFTPAPQRRTNRNARGDLGVIQCTARGDVMGWFLGQCRRLQCNIGEDQNPTLLRSGWSL